MVGCGITNVEPLYSASTKLVFADSVQEYIFMELPPESTLCRFCGMKLRHTKRFLALGRYFTASFVPSGRPWS
jgi:hypothetical protein